MVKPNGGFSKAGAEQWRRNRPGAHASEQPQHPVRPRRLIAEAFERLPVVWRVRPVASTFQTMAIRPLPHDDAVRRIVAAEPEIRRFGVRRLALFGSVLRNEARPDSDVDLLVEFGPGQKTFDHFMGLALFLEDLLERRVELLTPESLSPYIGPHILKAAKDVLRAA
jgi:uncharacterized protein